MLFVLEAVSNQLYLLVVVTTPDPRWVSVFCIFHNLCLVGGNGTSVCHKCEQKRTVPSFFVCGLMVFDGHNFEPLEMLSFCSSVSLSAECLLVPESVPFED